MRVTRPPESAPLVAATEPIAPSERLPVPLGWAGISLLLALALVAPDMGCSSPEGDPTPSPSAQTPSPSPTDPEGLELVFPYEGALVTTPTLALYALLGDPVPPQAFTAFLDDTDVSSLLRYEPSDSSLRAQGIPLERVGERRLEVRIWPEGGEVRRAEVRFMAFPDHALASVATDARALIDGPEARGKLGDFLLQNDRIQVLISTPGRPFDHLHAYGGQPIDAEQVRLPWEPERDGLGAVIPALNFESTQHPQTVEIVSDGRDGASASVEARGVDDLLLTMNPSTMAPLLIPAELSGLPVGTYVPVSADDQDIPVEVVTTYTLAPGSNALEISTLIRNTGTQNLSLYLGDYLNATGEVDYFSPGFGFRANMYFRHEGELLAFAGYGLNAGLTYGLVPDRGLTTSISLPGTIVTFAGQDAQIVIVEGQPPVTTLAPGTSIQHRRWLVVAETVADVTGARCRLLDVDCGEISGRVTVKGQPVAGADVSLWRPTTPAEYIQNRDKQAVTHWRTGADGTFQGLVPEGSFRVSANLPHAAYPGGGTTPPQQSVEIMAERAVTQVNFDFPAPAVLEVTVADESGAPIPARATLVGFDPSPDPLVHPLVYPGYESTGALFSDIWADPLPYGVARIGLAGPDGRTGPLEVEPGDYQLVVSRGPFFSSVALPVTLREGETTRIETRLTRVVDTDGFLSGDFHVHGIDSFDASIPRDFRLLGMAAESVDVFSTTDHGIRIDLQPELDRLGLADRVVAVIGEEITTFDLGHFNAFPLERDLASRTFGGTDWAGQAPIGRSYPSMGTYDLSPSELFQRLREEPSSPVLMVNHLNTPTLGYFSLIGADTGQAPPQAHVPTCLGRQAPDTVLWNDNFDALELWRIYEDDASLLLEENLGDWFNLLNQGIVRTSLSNSDTHSRTMNPAGAPRNLIATSPDVPFTRAALGPEIASRVREGRVLNTNAPFLEVTLEAVQTGEKAGHRVELPLQLTAPGGEVKVQVRVLSPEWAPFDQIQLFVNTAPTPLLDDGDDAPGRTYPFSTCSEEPMTFPDVPRYLAQTDPPWTYTAGLDFSIEEVVVHPEIPGASRLEAQLEIPLKLEQDSWLVVLVRGTPGTSKPLFPIQPEGLVEDTNATLQDLTDGNRGEGGVLAQAFSNPLFVDVNGNGRFEPPGLRLAPARREKRANPNRPAWQRQPEHTRSPDGEPSTLRATGG